MTKPAIGRLAAYGSVVAVMGVTVPLDLPRSKMTTAMTAMMTTAATAMANGSQLRSRGSDFATNSGPLFTTRILHPLSCIPKDLEPAADWLRAMCAYGLFLFFVLRKLFHRQCRPGYTVAAVIPCGTWRFFHAKVRD